MNSDEIYKILKKTAWGVVLIAIIFMISRFIKKLKPIIIILACLIPIHYAMMFYYTNQEKQLRYDIAIKNGNDITVKTFKIQHAKLRILFPSNIYVGSVPEIPLEDK